jgi:hypothetical protein
MRLKLPHGETAINGYRLGFINTKRLDLDGRYKATWNKEFNLPWRMAGLLESSRR